MQNTNKKDCLTCKHKTVKDNIHWCKAHNRQLPTYCHVVPDWCTYDKVNLNEG